MPDSSVNTRYARSRAYFTPSARAVDSGSAPESRKFWQQYVRPRITLVSCELYAAAGADVTASHARR